MQVKGKLRKRLLLNIFHFVSNPLKYMFENKPLLFIIKAQFYLEGSNGTFVIFSKSVHFGVIKLFELCNIYNFKRILFKNGQNDYLFFIYVLKTKVLQIKYPTTKILRLIYFITYIYHVFFTLNELFCLLGIKVFTKKLK